LAVSTEHKEQQPVTGDRHGSMARQHLYAKTPLVLCIEVSVESRGGCDNSLFIDLMGECRSVLSVCVSNIT